MLNEKKALMLIGSPKIKNSTSESLGNHLIKNLTTKGYNCEKLHILSTLRKDTQQLLDKVNDTDLIILAFPLYVDSLPSPVIKALELIDDHRKTNETNKNQSFIVIMNCGFPESFQNNTALRICKNFAHQTGFRWLGGLAMGGGGAIGGKPLEQLGGMTRNITAALDRVAEEISKGEDISLDTIELMSKKLFPGWLYTFAAGMGWKSQAKGHNAKKHLYDKPYLKQ